MTRRPRPADRAVIQISRPLHDRLTDLKNEQQQQLGRQVTFTEIIEQLLDDQRAFARIGKAWQKVEQASREPRGAA